MFVVATAGHVDHGKSTLVRALTDMDPDRWEEEKRRGLTIDLGFVWTRLPSGADVAFVDVPGHERFLGNTLAGLGPAPAVMFVVAADEGWQQQSADHRDAAAALGITRGVIVLTRCDRVDQRRRDQVADQVRQEFAPTPLADAPVVAVSARTGDGIDKLRECLDQVLAAGPVPDPQARVRLWIDRAFSVKGAGSVVTGTLAAGTLTVGDALELVSAEETRPVDIRGLHSENIACEAIEPVSRAAVNLRGIDTETIHRGDALVSPGRWPRLTTVDVHRRTGGALDELPGQLLIHVGTASVEARVRPFGPNSARVVLARPLPLALGDALVLRGPGAHSVLAGVDVVDLVPPALTRRGDGARRAQELADGAPVGAGALVKRAGYLPLAELELLGFNSSKRSDCAEASPPAGVVEFSGYWIATAQVTKWKKELVNAVASHRAADPLAAGLPRGAALKALEISDPKLLNLAVAAAKLKSADGVIVDPATVQVADLGAAEPAVARLEARLRVEPFAAPKAGELADAALGVKQLAAAERAGRLLRLEGGIVVLPTAPAEAVARLRTLDQPFTTSQARQALGATRRVAIPVLERLDSLGLTERLDGSLRRVR